MKNPLRHILPPELSTLYEPRLYKAADGSEVIEVMALGKASEFTTKGEQLEAAGEPAGRMVSFQVEAGQ